MDIKSLSEILGHATVDTTLNRYVHSSRKMKEKYLIILKMVRSIAIYKDNL